MSIRSALIALVVLTGMSAVALADAAPGPGPRGQRNQRAADDAAAAVGFAICAGSVGFVIGIGILIWMIVFTVGDANKRGMDPTIWVILEIFLGLIGLIIYLCVREPLKSERRRRGEYYDEDDDYLDRPRRSRRIRKRDDEYDERFED